MQRCFCCLKEKRLHAAPFGTPCNRFRVNIYELKIVLVKAANYFVRYMLLLTTNACATETTHANTIKPIIIIIVLSFLYLLLLITVLSFSRVLL